MVKPLKPNAPGQRTVKKTVADGAKNMLNKVGGGTPSKGPQSQNIGRPIKRAGLGTQAVNNPLTVVKETPKPKKPAKKSK